MDATQACPSESQNEQTPQLGGKYLTFKLDDEEYGFEILKVREIIGVLDITKVPQTPNCVKGVINLRGRVIPVLDLRAKFGLEPCAYTEETCTIVVDVGVLMGVIVDTVSEVHYIPSENIELAPQMGAAVDTTFIRGMARVNEELKILLDIERVLNSESLVDITTDVTKS